MSQVAETLVRNRMRIAAIAAGGIAAVLVFQDVIGNVVASTGYSFPSSSGADEGDYWSYLWQDFVFGNLLILAFAVGVWISLWRLAAVTSELAPMAVVLRGLLAAAVGAIVVFLVHLGFNLVWPLSGVGSLFGNSFPVFPWGGIAQAVNTAFQLAAAAFLQQGPVVVLVVVLVWLWLTRHPSRSAVSADTAEV
jgi:hypothetical protein